MHYGKQNDKFNPAAANLTGTRPSRTRMLVVWEAGGETLPPTRLGHPDHLRLAFGSCASRFRTRSFFLQATQAVRLRIDIELPLLIPELLLFCGEDELAAAIDTTKRSVDYTSVADKR